MEIIKVKKGDSTDVQIVKHKIDGELVTDYTNYVLKMSVLNIETKESAGIDRTIKALEDGTGFAMGLSPVDTNKLGVGDYLIVADLEKSEDGVPVFNREMAWPLTVNPSLRDN